MLNKTNILSLIVLAVLTGCKAEEDGQLPDGPISTKLVFTVSPNTGGETRMAPGVVQSDNTYRGLQNLSAFTFSIASNADKVVKDDDPRTSAADKYDHQYLNKTTDGTTPAAFYYIENCTFVSGVNAMLVYANAKTESLPNGISFSGNNDTDSKFYNGSLNANISQQGDPENISFAPVQIVATTSTPTDATALANYLTSIANAAGWSTSQNTFLKDFYERFIGKIDNTNYSLIASSSANVLQYVSTLREQISKLPRLSDENSNIQNGLSANDAAIQSAIIAAIDVGYDAGANPKPQLKNLPNNYPASIGLPAGAAAVRWTGNAFEPQIQTTTLADLNTITRYSYPAELWYFTNSRIKTSNEENLKDSYAALTSWNTLLAKYEYNNGTVDYSTKSVAIIEPLQYAVARLEVILNKTKTTIPDADGVNMTVGTDKFPMTGIIVGQQRPVGFDFKPTVTKGEDGKYSDLDVRFAYDPYPVDASSNAIYLSSASNSAATSTLVLQTPDDEEVTILLEFENNCGKQFRGKSGIIYPGTKFYLTGTLDPNDGTTTNTNAVGRVFTQDFTTSVSATVSSLENAYNVMPNILQGRLEIGVELTTKWEPTTPVTVPLN